MEGFLFKSDCKYKHDSSKLIFNNARVGQKFKEPRLSDTSSLYVVGVLCAPVQCWHTVNCMNLWSGDPAHPCRDT